MEKNEEALRGTAPAWNTCRVSGYTAGGSRDARRKIFAVERQHDGLGCRPRTEALSEPTSVRLYVRGVLLRLRFFCGLPQKPPMLPKISAMSRGSTSVTVSSELLTWWITIDTWA